MYPNRPVELSCLLDDLELVSRVNAEIHFGALPIFNGIWVRPQKRTVLNGEWTSNQLEELTFDDLMILINTILEDDAKAQQHGSQLNSSRFTKTNPLTEQTLREHTFGPNDSHAEVDTKDLHQLKNSVLSRLAEAHSVVLRSDHRHVRAVDEESGIGTGMMPLEESERMVRPLSDQEDSVSEAAHTWSVASGQSAELVGTWYADGLSREELASLLSLTPIMYRHPLQIRGTVWMLSCEPFLVVSTSTQGMLVLHHGISATLKFNIGPFAEDIQIFCQDHFANKPSLNRGDAEFPAILFWEWLLAYVAFHLNKAKTNLDHHKSLLDQAYKNRRWTDRHALKSPPDGLRIRLDEIRKTANALIPVEQLLGSSSEAWSLPVIHPSWGLTQKAVRPNLARPMQQMMMMLAKMKFKCWPVYMTTFDELFFDLMRHLEKLEALYSSWELLNSEFQLRSKNTILQMHSLVLTFDVVFAVLSLIYAYGGMNIFPPAEADTSLMWYYLLSAPMYLGPIFCLISVTYVVRTNRIESEALDATMFRIG